MNDNRVFKSKEADMLSLLQMGMPSVIIQKVLGISVCTVANYLTRLRESGEWAGEMVSLYNQFKGAKFSFHTESKRCKIQPIEKFDTTKTTSHWSVDRWWSKEENIPKIDFFMRGVKTKLDLEKEISVFSEHGGRSSRRKYYAEKLDLFKKY